VRNVKIPTTPRSHHPTLPIQDIPNRANGRRGQRLSRVNHGSRYALTPVGTLCLLRHLGWTPDAPKDHAENTLREALRPTHPFDMPCNYCYECPQHSIVFCSYTNSIVDLHMCQWRSTADTTITLLAFYFCSPMQGSTRVWTTNSPFKLYQRSIQSATMQCPLKLRIGHSIDRLYVF
jgi:hypothetical protein